MSPSNRHIRVGDSVEHSFTITEDDMRLFQKLSADYSLIHTDSGFARERGFDGVIVYGGLLLAHLSHVVGQHLPGRKGTSASWSISYRAPLYVGETAALNLTVTNVSVAAGMVEGRYKITCGDRTIAKGQTQSIVPAGMLDDEI